MLSNGDSESQFKNHIISRSHSGTPNLSKSATGDALLGYKQPQLIETK
jgi:hypothetical protein